MRHEGKRRNSYSNAEPGEHLRLAPQAQAVGGWRDVIAACSINGTVGAAVALSP
jgi:hypothetical protein